MFRRAFRGLILFFNIALNFMLWGLGGGFIKKNYLYFFNVMLCGWGGVYGLGGIFLS